MHLKEKKVLLIDDDPSLLRLVEYTLDGEGAHVTTATNGAEGLRRFYATQPDLIVLDVTMPEMDGWETCRNIRQLADVPIIMLTARGQDSDVVRGYDIGVDDYIVKPFSVDVLVAHARAVLRRAAMPPATPRASTFDDGWLSVALEERVVLVNGVPAKLTATEFRLFAHLVQNPNRVLTFQQLLSNVWGWEYQDEFHQARLYICRLRQKIERDPKDPQYILTEYGVGYRFAANS